jgi:hypothetical protein
MGVTGTGIASIFGNDYNDGDGAACADSSCTGFLVCQNFEGAGYDNSESWEEDAGDGTVDEDDATATVLRGSQQLKLAGSGASSSTKKTFTAAGDLWVHFRYKPTDSTPATSHNILVFRDGSDNDVGSIDIRTNGTMRFYHGTKYVSTMVAIFADGTKIHFWVHYAKGTGSNGTMEVYWSANATRPALSTTGCYNTDVDQPCSLTTGTGAVDVAAISIREYNNTTGGAYFDQVLAKATEIGSVCD